MQKDEYSGQKYAFSVQYHGKNYCGFQVQDNAPSVQQEIQEAIEKLLRVSIKIKVSGRTDTGVHAQCQVLHFSLPENYNIKSSALLKIERFIYALNAILPRDITFFHGQKVSHNFHARFSCIGRQYYYRIINRHYKPVHKMDISAWIKPKLNIDLMRKAIKELEGEKDFAAFTKKELVKAGEKTFRRIDQIKIMTPSPEEIIIFFAGSGFLHNMIRILTGLFIDIGLGKVLQQDIPLLLEKRDRNLVGVTMPPQGLVFRNALYKEYQTPENLIGDFY